MKSIATSKSILVLSLLGLSDGAVFAGSCNLPLACSQSAASSTPAFSITNTDNGVAGTFSISDPNNNKPALMGRTSATGINAFGIAGQVLSPTSGDHSAGIRGINRGNDVSTGTPLRLGVWGQADALGAAGVLGQSSAGIGVMGLTDTATGTGVFGQAGAGGGVGVMGNSDNDKGVWGNSNFRGVVGTLGRTSCSAPGGAYAVGGCAATTGDGLYGRANQGIGIRGESVASIGVWGKGNSDGSPDNARGVVGTLGFRSCAAASSFGYGVGGCADAGDGVVGRSNTGRAGVFAGNVLVTGNLEIQGTLSKASGSFKIDHPKDPENKYLYHSFVESSDMMGLYTGNAVLDKHGKATVVLPGWFEALNRDFRYQLTAIGAPGPNLYIAAPVAHGRFQIAGGSPNMTVSWQITGVRHDPYAEMNRIPVEEPKPQAERGKYLHPLAYGKPPELGIDTASAHAGNSIASVK